MIKASVLGLVVLIGSTENPETILANGGQFSVTANLHAALAEFKRLLRKSRGKGPDPLLWVDSICINQDSTGEKEGRSPEWTQDFGVLSLGRVGALDGVPSWVPDLRHRDPNVREYFPQPTGIDMIENTILVPAIILGECVSATPARTLQDVSADPLRSFVERVAAIFAEAARIRGVPTERVFDGWLREQVSRARPGLSLSDGQDPENMIRSLMRVYERIRGGDAFDAGTLSIEEQSSLGSAQQLLSQPEFQALILCSELFVLHNGSIGSARFSPTDVRRGVLL
ncbi:hypothetical protein DL765_003365 [Monosporascus sp. GIB2]|nr:hypothetical protein DL765_003365 [Monosporascus sp. GIB2]